MDKYILIELSPGGYVCHLKNDNNNVRLDGPGDPDLSKAADGTCVLNIRTAALRRDYGHNLINAPSLDVTKPDGYICDCISPTQVSSLAIKVEPNSILFKHIAMRASGVFPGPLDCVSVNDYIKWWKDHGAKIGIIETGKIKWQDDN